MNFKLIRLCKDLLTQTKGAALVEFALIGILILPVLILPIHDIQSRLILESRIIKTSRTVADMLSMSVEQATADDESAIPSAMILSDCTLDNILRTSDYLMTPNPLAGSNFSLRVTSIQKTISPTAVASWNASYNGTSTSVVAADLPLPANFYDNMELGEAVLIVQVSYPFAPTINLGISPLSAETITHTSYFPVRFGSLNIIEPGCP